MTLQHPSTSTGCFRFGAGSSKRRPFVVEDGMVGKTIRESAVSSHNVLLLLLWSNQASNIDIAAPQQQ